MKRKAIIFGVKGIKLTPEEKRFLSSAKPWGIILFSRNIKDLFQLRKLINDIKKIFKDKNYPILLDQEGGKVSRLDKIIDFSVFSQEFFGTLYLRDKKLFHKIYEIYIDKVCHILKEVGINIVTAPVLDIRRKKSHNIIGSRSFSENPDVVSEIGKICINLYKKRKIATVIKHIPGHGLSKVDSHFKVPIVLESKKYLNKKDFKPFKKCPSFFAMTAHIIYKNYDSKFTATHSKVVINDVIRKEINFKGMIITDDISMKALNFSLKDNVFKALDAGCNLILHCNANLREMRILTKIIPTIDKFTHKKTSQFYKFLG